MGYGLDRTNAAHVGRLWKLPIIYSIDPAFSSDMKNLIQDGARAWGFRFFQPANSGEAPLRVVLAEQSKWSSGDQGWQGMGPGSGPRVNCLSLQKNSSLNSIVHELGHALGLSHEHDRPDAAGYREANRAAIARDERGDECGKSSEKPAEKLQREEKQPGRRADLLFSDRIPPVEKKVASPHLDLCDLSSQPKSKTKDRLDYLGAVGDTNRKMGTTENTFFKSQVATESRKKNYKMYGDYPDLDSIMLYPKRLEKTAPSIGDLFAVAEMYGLSPDAPPPPLPPYPLMYRPALWPSPGTPSSPPTLPPPPDPTKIEKYLKKQGQ